MNTTRYRILIVDDEKIIRDGIARTVNWENLGVSLAGTAANGCEAYEAIIATQPDIVLTDIVMPEMNGIELVKKITHEFRRMKFIILSGYDEFEFATEAMHCGIRHYLLKPTSEEEIVATVGQLVTELDAEKQKLEVVTKLSAKLESVKPELKKQFLRDCIANRTFTEGLRHDRMHVLGIPDTPLQLLILRPEDHTEPTAIPSLERICTYVFNDTELFCTYTMDSLVCVFPLKNGNVPTAGIREVQQLYRFRNGREVTVAISRMGRFAGIHSLYTEARELLEHDFLFGHGSIITGNEVNLDIEDQCDGEIELDFETVCQAIRSGNVDDIRARLKEISDTLVSTLSGRTQILVYFTRQLLKLHWTGNSQRTERFLEILAAMRNCDSIDNLVNTVTESIVEVARINEARIGRTGNALVCRMIQRAREHLADEHFSLKWLSENEVFGNADYLSKLFKRETGRRFTDVLTELRVESAKELFLSDANCRVYEVAARTGFGTNTQYFSQIFKRIVGVTPSEYRSSLHHSVI